MPNTRGNFHACSSLELHVAVIGPHHRGPVQDVEELASVDVGMPLLLTTRRDALLDDGEVLPIEKPPTIR